VNQERMELRKTGGPCHRN